MGIAKPRTALKVALAYAAVAGAFVLLSGRLLRLFTPDLRLFILLGALQDILFVVATALTLYFLLRRALQRLEGRDAQIREIEQRLQLQGTVLESAANAIMITDREGRITWVNPAFTRLTDYTAAEALGRNPRILKSGEHDQAFYQRMWETILSGREWHGELVNRRRDGSLYVEEQTITSVRDAGGAVSHFICIKQDITERNLAERALRESEATFRNLVEKTSDWVWEIDERNRYTYVSPRVREILGYAPEEILGKTPFDLMPKEEATRVAEILAPITGDTKPFMLLDNVCLHKAGHRVVLETSGTPILDSQGVFRGYRGIDRDITVRKRAEQALRTHTRQLDAIRSVTAEITRELDLIALLRLISHRVGELIGTETGAVWLWDEPSQLVVPAAWHGYGEWWGQVRLRLGEGVAGAVAQRRAGLMLNDYPTSPYALPFFLERMPEVTAVLGEPLVYRDQLLGVITVDNTGIGRGFTEQDRETLALFAPQAAIAIENARLYSEALETTQRLEGLTRTSAKVAGTLRLEEALDAIAEEAAKLLKIEGAGFRLLEGERLVVAGRYGLAHHVMLTPSIRVGESLSGLVAQQARSIAVTDIREDQQYIPAHRSAAMAHGVVAFLGVPLLYRERVIGVLNVYGKEQRTFSDGEIRLLSAFADQAAIAIENARLFRQEQARREQLEAIRAVTAEITRELDLSTLLDLITRRAVELVGGASGNVSLWDEASQLLVPRAWLGHGAWFDAMRWRLGEGVVGTIAERRQGMIVNDYRASPYAHPLILKHAAISAVLGEPLLYQDRLLGVITTDSQEPGRTFTEEDERLLRLFAAHAAIAIENARLHETAIRQAQQLGTLNELIATLTTALDPQGAAREILTAVQVLIPGAVGRLWGWAKEENVLRLMTGVGLREPEGGRAPTAQPGEGLAGIAAATRQPVISLNASADPRFINQAWAAAEGLVSCVVLPLVYREQVVGVLAIYTREPHEFTHEEVRLLSSFAAQAAIAIENARLYQETRQHAAGLEQHAQERMRELEAARAQAETASRHKSEFLANMSHEFRTPLNSIIGFADLVERQVAGPLTEKQGRYLGHIHKAGEHLLHLIDDILDFSKVGTGSISHQPERLQVAPILEDVVALARGLADKKAQALHADIAPDLPPVYADPARLKQVVFNLLSNAVKFTPRGGRITLTGRKVNWTTGPRADPLLLFDSSITAAWDTPAECLEVRVTDSGVGIKADDLPRLFQEFTQLEPAATKRHEGTGLGLALTRRLVELHGGRIWAESEGEGRGSTFTVILPFAGPEK